MQTEPNDNLYAYANPSSCAAANAITIGHEDLLKGANSIGNLPQGREHRRQRLMVLAPLFDSDGRIPIVIDMRLTALIVLLKCNALHGFVQPIGRGGQTQIAMVVWQAAAAAWIKLDAEVPYFDQQQFVDLAMSMVETEGCA